MKPISRRFLFPMAAALVLALAGLGVTPAARAADTPVPDDLRMLLESFRSDMNGFKIRTLNEVMALGAEEAERFWPLYRDYENELAAVGDRKVALLREFAGLRQAGRIDSADWDRLTRRWLANVQDRVDLWKKYRGKIAKAVSPMRAAQFLQVEHQIALFVDLTIASEMPPIR